jgi:hypothetical protein
MRYVHFTYYNDDYNYNGSSDIAMDILGLFFISDISWHGISSVRNWILNPQYTELETNITTLEKQGDYIILRDLFPQEEYEERPCVITTLQFFQLLHDWKEAYEIKPKTISIICENDQFTMQTQN